MIKMRLDQQVCNSIHGVRLVQKATSGSNETEDLALLDVSLIPESAPQSS